MVLAATSRATSECTTGRGNRAVRLLVSPFRVRQPIQALIVCMAAMNGIVSSIVQVSA
jgi:hypothetical protein